MSDEQDLVLDVSGNESSAEHRIATKVAPGVGMEVVAVLKILQLVLPVLIGCLGGDGVSSPGAVKAAVKEQNERQPARLRRRMAARIMRESDKPLTKDQALTMAEGIIDETLSADDAEVTAKCNPFFGGTDA